MQLLTPLIVRIQRDRLYQGRCALVKCSSCILVYIQLDFFHAIRSRHYLAIFVRPDFFKLQLHGCIGKLSLIAVARLEIRYVFITRNIRVYVIRFLGLASCFFIRLFLFFLHAGIALHPDKVERFRIQDIAVRRLGFHQFIQRVNTHINFAGVRSRCRYKRNFTLFIRICGDRLRRVPRAALLIIRRQFKLRALKHFVLTILVHFVERQFAIIRTNRAATC